MIYRSEEIAGNTALARRPAAEEMARREGPLIETRGEGGFTIEPPSNGRVHPTGGEYRQLQGSFASIQTITPEERRPVGSGADLRRDAEAAATRPTVRAHDRTSPVTTTTPAAMCWDYWKPTTGPLSMSETASRSCGGRGRQRESARHSGYGGTRYFYLFTTSTEFEATGAIPHSRSTPSSSTRATSLPRRGPWLSRVRQSRTAHHSIERTTSTAPWPVLDDAALYGLAGDVVRTIEPHTEGDPAACSSASSSCSARRLARSPHAPSGPRSTAPTSTPSSLGRQPAREKGPPHNEVKRIVAD